MTILSQNASIDITQLKKLQFRHKKVNFESKFEISLRNVKFDKKMLLLTRKRPLLLAIPNLIHKLCQFGLKFQF